MNVANQLVKIRLFFVDYKTSSKIKNKPIIIFFIISQNKKHINKQNKRRFYNFHY